MISKDMKKRIAALGVAGILMATGCSNANEIKTKKVTNIKSNTTKEQIYEQDTNKSLTREEAVELFGEEAVIKAEEDASRQVYQANEEQEKYWDEFTTNYNKAVNFSTIFGEELEINCNTVGAEDGLASGNQIGLEHYAKIQQSLAKRLSDFQPTEEEKIINSSGTAFLVYDDYDAICLFDYDKQYIIKDGEKQIRILYNEELDKYHEINTKNIKIIESNGEATIELEELLENNTNYTTIYQTINSARKNK